METSELTGRVRIIRTPSGEAPEELRVAWIGIEFDCHPIAGPGGLVGGVISGDLRIDRRDVITVPQDVALAALREKNPDAAQWWAELGFPRQKSGEHLFSFGLDEVEVLHGIEMQKMIRVDDDMQGDPYR